MNKELKNITIKLAKKIAVESGHVSDNESINSAKNELNNKYKSIFLSKLKKNSKASYKKNLESFSNLKTDNIVNEIKNIDKAVLITDTENVLQGIQSRYNDQWLRVEKNIIEARQVTDQIFDRYMRVMRVSPEVMVVWKADPDCCDTCQKLDGVTLPPDHNFWDKNTPGSIHFNCRCYTELTYNGIQTSVPDVKENNSLEPRSSGKIFKI